MICLVYQVDDVSPSGWAIRVGHVCWVWCVFRCYVQMLQLVIQDLRNKKIWCPKPASTTAPGLLGHQCLRLLECLAWVEPQIK